MKTKYQRKEEKLMDMKKYKWVSFVLCLAMIFSGFGGVAYAVEDPTPDSESSVMSTSPDAITSEPGTILIDNTAPIASDQSITTEMNQPVDILLTGTDLNDDPLTFVIVDQPANGKLTGDGVNWMYTPLVDYTGEDTFTFKVNDGMHDSNLVTVSIQVDNFLKEMVFDPALESNSIQSMTDGVFYATSEVLPVTGESPNGKTRAYFIWFEGYDLYVAIIFDAKKPIEQITFDNKIDSPTTFPSTDVNTWTGELMTIDGRQYPVSDYPRQGSTSKWAVINLGQEVISGFFDLGINTGAGGFSTTIMVEIDSELQVYHQYDGDEPLLDGTQSGFLTGPVGEYYTFDVYPVSKAGFNLQSIQIRINGGSLSTLTTSALIGGYLLGTVPAISGPEKAEITFIYVGIGEALNITSYSGIYDSEEHSIIVNNTITGDAIWYSLTDNGLDWSLTQPMFTDVTGAITVYVKVTNPNYIDRTGSGTVTITEREITITAADASKPYDGTALTTTGWALTSGTVATGDAINSVNVTGSRIVVGTSASIASGAVIEEGTENVVGNYDISYMPGTLTVTASTGAALDITSYSGIYDGAGHSITVNNAITGDTVTYSTDGGVTYTGTNPAYTNVGSYMVDVKVTNPNYIDKTGSGTVEITERAITITAGSASKTYNGTPLTNNGWALTGGTLASGDTISVVTVTGSQTPVGSSPNVPSAAVIMDGENDVTSNYDITYVNGTLTVTSGGGGGGTTIIEEEVPLALITDHIAYIQGYPENVVKPEGNVTREEVAAVFFRLLEPSYREDIRAAKSNFPDVGANRWSTKHIGTLVNGKIVEGYLDKTFKPGNPITRAELATIASRFDALEATTSSIFSDVKGHWAEKYINSAQEKGWVNGYPDGTFKPDQYITRAEFVTLVNNVLERRVKEENILPEARLFPDLLKSMWYYEAMEEAINGHLYIRLEDTYEEWTEIYTC